MKTRTRRAGNANSIGDMHNSNSNQQNENIANESSKQNVNNNNLIVVLRRLDFVCVSTRVYRCNAEHKYSALSHTWLCFGSNTFGARVHLWNGFIVIRSIFILRIVLCLRQFIRLLATRAMDARRGLCTKQWDEILLATHNEMRCGIAQRTKGEKRDTEKLWK